MEYDLLDRIIEEKLEDEQGRILKKVSYQYDLLGNRTHVVEETEAGPSQIITLYNSDKKPVITVDQEGNKTHVTYNYAHLNSAGQRVLQTTAADPLGRQTIITYDALERPVSIVRKDPFGVLLANQDLLYDVQGNIIRIIDHIIVHGEERRSVATALFYQETNQLTCFAQACGLPEQQITHIHYNKFGQKNEVIKPDGTHLHYQYDALGRLAGYAAGDYSFAYQYAYNVRNQPIRVDDGILKTQSLFHYDSKGRLVNEVLSNGLSVSYEYDLLDRVIALILPDSSRVAYRYDAINLREVARWKGNELLYAHQYEAFDLAGLNLKAACINRETICYVYDQFKRPIAQESSSYKQTGMRYDRGGRLCQYDRQDALCSIHYDFAYDDLDHLVSETGPSFHNYACDSLHNRVSKDGVSYSSNGLHQLIQQGDCTYTYDLNGNLSSKKQGEKVTMYRYDANDHLVAVQSGGETIRYLYDAFNRRVAKIKGNKTSRYLYIGQDEIGCVDEAGEIQELRILGKGHGAEIGASIAIELHGKVYAPTHDFGGNIVSLSDLEGKTIETYRYSAFGELIIYGSQGEKLSASSIENPWLFSSKRLDEETGFVNFGRRYYEPETGRWITADPSGFIDGPNLYAYLHHQPLNSFDLYGLQEETGQTDNEPYYPLADVDHDKNNQSDKQEDCAPNEAPLGFIEKRTGKKTKMYYCGFNQMLEMGICFMHGIMNKLNDAYESAELISKFGDDHYVTFVDNSSRGLVFDLMRCVCELYLYTNTSAVKTQQKIWNTYFAACGPNAILLHFCHSEGAIITRNALMSYPEELRKRIIVVAIAPGAYIDDKYALDVIHYRSTRDIVPLLDFVGAYRCRHSTVVLKPHPDAPWFDHSFNSPTYHNIQEYHVKEYQQIYGGI